jgi:CheY-like chemotaxis protein
MKMFNTDRNLTIVGDEPLSSVQSTSAPEPFKVLILEDQLLIIMDIEDTLVAEGFNIVGCLSSCEAALKWLGEDSPDVVVLDIELRDGFCVEVAHTLAKKRIPFVVHSGILPTSPELDPVFQHGQWVGKPSRESDLLNAVWEAVSQWAA